MSNSRKRGAPSGAPTAPVPQNYVNDNDMSRWANTGGDPANFLDDPNFYAMQPQQQFAQPITTPSNAVARRQMNNALVPANPRGAYDSTVDPWGGFDVDSGALIQQNQQPQEETTEPDSVEKLEEMAAKAKKVAQSKRKSIPPFVQKLSSFLEEGKNEDLIRWSDNGDSFVVLDEDEFAKTLIPELFKHNKYASFVRQLNMYGFHKCVGLSDNSMRASERKNKSPSEYANPYFRRGHPNLLWLINKPKSEPKAGARSGKAGDEKDSDEEGLQEDPVSFQSGPSNALPAGRALPAAEGTPLQKKEMGVIRDEIRKVREQQKLILGAINRIQQNNNDLYNQAMMFQNQHDRHQNSINAILNFLANVFRKTLEDQSNTQNVNDIISSLMTGQNQQGGHGNVVDLGDFFQSQMDQNNGMPPKRARGLLPPIPGQTSSPGPSTRSNSASNFSGKQAQMGHVTELTEPSPSDSPSLRHELETNPQERMMKIINDHNATNSPSMDKAAEFVANTPNTLNNDQRSQLVNFMASQASPSASSPGNSTQPKTGTNGQPSGAPPSLSPIMRSPQLAVPSLNQISANQDELARLQKLQVEQDAKIHELGSLLGPLSPSGRIPGLDDPDAYFAQPAVDDFDQLFNSDAFLHDPAFANTEDFNFGLGSDGMEKRDKDTPSSTGTEEIQRDDLADTAPAATPTTRETRGSKRQRTT